MTERRFEMPYVESLGAHVVFLAVPRREVIYVKLLIETYESIGVARSVEPRYDADTTLVVLIAVPDFSSVTERVVAELAEEGRVRVLAPTAERIREVEATLLDGA